MSILWIDTASPVLGLGPLRAGLLLVPKVPYLASCTVSPSARALPIVANTSSTAPLATALLTLIHSRPVARPRLSCSSVLLLSLPDHRLLRFWVRAADHHVYTRFAISANKALARPPPEDRRYLIVVREYYARSLTSLQASFIQSSISSCTFPLSPHFHTTCRTPHMVTLST